MFVFLCLQPGIAAQTPYDSMDFSVVDSFVLSVKYQNDISKLAFDLTDRFPDDIDKTRAIFKWITNNIAFDFRFINRGKEIEKPDCYGDDACPSILIKWENDYLKRILKSKKAIADGYARLFKKLCDICYVQAEMIPGYARTRPYQIGNSIGINHAWNAVLIDTTWLYLDPAWAAGNVIEDEETGAMIKFEREYHNYYWLSSFERFSRNHYPQTGKWVVKPPITKEQFFNNPHYFSIEVLEHLTEQYPATGVLKVKKGDTIYFKFNYTREIKLLQINSNIFRNPSLWTTINTSKRKTKIVRDTWAEKKQVYIPFKKEANNYQFNYVVKDESLYYLEIVFDYKPAVRYRVRVAHK
jgi:hypothetical protein